MNLMAASVGLEGWVARVEPLLHLWRSLEFVCICIRSEAGWTNLAGHAVLSSREPLENARIRPVVKLDQLVTLEGHLKTDTLQTLLNNLRRGDLVAGIPGYDVKLFVTRERLGSWHEPFFRGRVNSELDSELDFVAILGNYVGPHIHDLLTQRQMSEIDDNLRTGFRPFDGLAGLARTFALRPISASGGNAYFELIAPLPLRLGRVMQDLAEKTLTISVQALTSVVPENARVSGV